MIRIRTGVAMIGPYASNHIYIKNSLIYKLKILFTHTIYYILYVIYIYNIYKIFSYSYKNFSYDHIYNLKDFILCILMMLIFTIYV